MHIDVIATAGIVLSMLGVAGGFIILAMILTAPHALFSGLIWAIKRMGKRSKRR